MAIVDLKLSKADQQEEIAQPAAPAYPGGLCIHIDKDELDKLGLTDLPEVGDEFHIVAVGKITSVSSSASESYEASGVSLQITAMELTPEAEDEGEAAQEEGASAEASEVEGAKTLMHSAYRGRLGPSKPGDGD